MLEHGEEFTGCNEDVADGMSARQVEEDASGRRAALLEGAMTSTIKHPNVRYTRLEYVIEACFRCLLLRSLGSSHWFSIVSWEMQSQLSSAHASIFAFSQVVQTYDYRVVHLQQQPITQPGFLTPHRWVGVLNA